MANEIAVVSQTEIGSKGRAEIALALGKSPEDSQVSKYIMGAIKEIESKITLQSCTPQSIINCLIQCANIGLAVDNRHLAYLVPFGKECTLMPGYLGYVHTIHRADPSAFIVVEIVRNNDVFECGTQNGQAIYKFVPKNPFDASTANIRGVFCFIRTANGSSLSLMTRAELDKVRGCSKMKSGAVWTQWELEMMKKSAVRRACKLLFTEAVAKLNAIDDRLFDMSNRPQVATIAPTAPMPQAIEAAICAEGISTPESPESAPVSEPQAEQTATDNDTPKADALTFDGVVKAFSPQKGPKPASICIDDVWYQSPGEEVTALIEGLKGHHVSGTYAIQENGKYKNKVITTIGD